MLRTACENYLPTPEDRLALFTDASRLAWSGVLMAFKADQLDMPAGERDYRVVAWVGGCFKGPELGYGIPDKEVAGRVQRWAVNLNRFNATVHHIKGDDNFAADYASRCRTDLAADLAAPMGPDECRAAAIHHPAFEYPSLATPGHRNMEGAHRHQRTT